MTTTLRMPVPRPIVAVQLHRANVAADDPSAGKVRALLDLKERSRRAVESQRAAVECLRAIEAAVQQLPEQVQASLDQVAAIATELGMALAREIVGAALDAGLGDPTPTVARCLRQAVRGSGELTIYLAPEDLGPVLEGLEAQIELRPLMARSQFAADPNMPRGAVRAETDSGRLVYEPEAVLERICEAVRSEVRA